MGIYNDILSRLTSQPFRQTPDLATAEPPPPRLLESSALAALSAHVMLADTNDVIVYMNESVQQMLRRAEADIRKDLPHFDVDSLIGASMDVFHRNPAHQQALLASLTRPHEANIRVGGRHFTLHATPLFAQDSRVGTAVEWRDNTETMALREREQALQNEQQKRSVELGIIRSALERVSANVMMADNEGTIFFANEAVMKLLRNAETDIRKELPNFRVDEVVGGSFDRFHRQTSHQRTLLARLQAPHESNIAVGTRKFRLLASPVFAADGERLGTVVEWQDRTDELRMEQAVDQALTQAIAGDLSGQIDHSGYSPFLGRIAQGINQLISTFSTILGDAETSLEALARGDLQRSISTTYSGRYESLKQNINSTIAHLAGVVGEIDTAMLSVKQSSQEISLGNMNLSQRTEEQAASLEQTTAAMSEITQTVEQNSSNARLANELARDARSTAEDGGQVLNKAIAAMQAISDSSKRIEQIIQVIDEIAFQTNLLALNAAVEAARAGDQGRGFAVVADEVRNLASRSARAAKEIKGLISDSGTKVQEGATLVNRSGETLSCIIQSVKKVNDVIGEIAENSAEQARSLEEINKAVQEMDDMTQQNAALVEEAAAASESLHGQAEALSKLMEFFTVAGSRLYR